MIWLSSLPGWAMVALCVGGAIAYALIVVTILHRVLRDDGRERSGLTAAAYMTVLGSLFAILTAFLINTEYSTYRQASNEVGTEVAAAGELAYASASLPPADTALVQDALHAYLVVSATREWPHLEVDPYGPSPATTVASNLSQTVFSYGPRTYVNPSSVDAMQSAVATLSEARRQRIVLATQVLPLPLFVLSVLTGAALILGALLVALRSGPRYALVAAGIVLIVGFDLAAILAISAPFSGPFTVSTAPMTQIADEIQRGLYLPWVRS